MEGLRNNLSPSTIPYEGPSLKLKRIGRSSEDFTNNLSPNVIPYEERNLRLKRRQSIPSFTEERLAQKLKSSQKIKRDSKSIMFDPLKGFTEGFVFDKPEQVLNQQVLSVPKQESRQSQFRKQINKVAKDPLYKFNQELMED